MIPLINQKKHKKLRVTVPLIQGTCTQRVKITGHTKRCIGYKLIGWRCERGIYRLGRKGSNGRNAQVIRFSFTQGLESYVRTENISFSNEDIKFSVTDLMSLLQTVIYRAWHRSANILDGEESDISKQEFNPTTGQVTVTSLTGDTIFSLVQRTSDNGRNTVGHQTLLAGLGIGLSNGGFSAPELNPIQLGKHVTDQITPYPYIFKIFCPQIQTRTAGVPLTQVETIVQTPLVTVTRKEDRDTEETMINEGYTEVRDLFIGNLLEFKIDQDTPFPVHENIGTDSQNSPAVFELPNIYLRFEFLVEQ